jgi:hypothetical protein
MMTEGRRLLIVVPHEDDDLRMLREDLLHRVDERGLGAGAVEQVSQDDEDRAIPTVGDADGDRRLQRGEHGSRAVVQASPHRAAPLREVVDVNVSDEGDHAMPSTPD